MVAMDFTADGNRPLIVNCYGVIMRAAPPMEWRSNMVQALPWFIGQAYLIAVMI